VHGSSVALEKIGDKITNTINLPHSASHHRCPKLGLASPTTSPPAWPITIKPLFPCLTLHHRPPSLVLAPLPSPTQPRTIAFPRLSLHHQLPLPLLTNINRSLSAATSLPHDLFFRSPYTATTFLISLSAATNLPRSLLAF